MIDLDSIGRLSSLLDTFAAEAYTSAGVLAGMGDSAATEVTRVARAVEVSAGLVLSKAAAAEPGPLRPTAPLPVVRRSSADELQTLIESNRIRAWSELWLVVAELNRLSALGVGRGPRTDRLLEDYNALVRLVGTNLVYFNVDPTHPLGARARRAGYRAGVWIGPTDADHVLVMIPGMNTTTTSWLAHNLADAEQLQVLASDLAESHDKGEVAVVPLLSYSPPQTFLDAPLGRFWKDGSIETAQAIESLPLEGRHVTGWGHSYGAAVLGASSAVGGAFDDLIMVGAAGTGSESLEELRVGSEHLYVAVNWNDPIRLVPNDYHGVNPMNLPHVTVPTAPSADMELWKAILGMPWLMLDGVADHNYLDDEVAMRAFAAITIGLEELTD